MTCKCGLCEEYLKTHEHPVSVTSFHGYCNLCKKEIEIESVSQFHQSLPPFVPKNGKGIGMFLKHKLPKKMIILTGAGISTAAGIPEFRTPGTGLYDNLQKYNVPYPEMVSTLDYFDKHPEVFFAIKGHLMPGQGKYFPTVTHYFISFLVQKGIVLKYFSQNTDGLDIEAGIPREKVILCHGHFYTGHCRKCKKEFGIDYYFEDVKNERIPYCPCGGVIKPDIVFFGESMPEEFFDGLELFKEADFLLCMGTSLTVRPFCYLVNKVQFL